VAQFQAIQQYIRQAALHILPLRLADLPPESRAFDTTFSMGVLYHQRNPQAHLRQLRATLREGGELILETLILPGDLPQAVTPEDRYARMRNVWQLPTLSLLQQWLDGAGFAACRVVDTNVTSTDEQRTTEWMPFESLHEALDPQNSGLTIEGLPRPCRATLIARAAT
jgi:tRNA (mo5U34)-methyltransferase